MGAPVRVMLLVIGLTIVAVWLMGLSPSAEVIAERLALRSDFKTFWVAVHALEHGLNYFRPDHECHIMRQWVPHVSSCAFMVMPPWALLIIVPFSALPLSSAFVAWSAFNLALMALTVSVILKRPSGSRANTMVLKLGAFTFAPLLFALSTGHFTILIAIAGLSGMKLFARRSPFWSGMCFAILTIKPHIFSVLIGALAMHTVRSRAWRLLIGGLSGLAVLTLSTWLWSPHSLSQWASSSGNLSDLLRNRSETLVSEFRIGVQFLSGALPEWPVYAFPLAGILLGTICYRRLLSPAEWMLSANRVFALGLICAPYGWLYDSTILIPTYLALLGRVTDQGAERQSRIFALAVLCALVLPFVTPLSLSTYLHLTSFYPVLLLLAGELFLAPGPVSTKPQETFLPPAR